MRRFTLLACLALALLALTGCETMRRTWKDTQELYRTYVNVDPQVDLKAEDHDHWEAVLAPLLTPVDMQLGELVRVVDARDSFPDDAWTDGLLKRFPWLSGLAATDMSGAVLLARPEVTLKPLNMAPLVEAGDAWRDRRLRGFIEDTPLGPEIYVATPFFKDNTLQGVIAAHFDLRSLVQLSPDPQKLLVVSSEAVLWSGGFGDLAAAVQAEPWAERLKNEVQGEIEVQGRQLVWITRYLGDRQVVYLAELPPEE
ncbi:MAG: hypothetical protein AB1916_01015 [Thermodesulfobacteriota bacterium]